MTWTAYFGFSTEDKNLIDIGTNLERFSSLIESKKKILENDIVKSNPDIINIVTKEVEMELKSLKLQLIEQINNISWE